MKNQHLQEEFIRLRALGLSYDKIAKNNKCLEADLTQMEPAAFC